MIVSLQKNSAVSVRVPDFMAKKRSRGQPKSASLKTETRSPSHTKLGCVVRMVVCSILPHTECGQNDHRKDAPPFRWKMKWSKSIIWFLWCGRSAKFFTALIYHSLLSSGSPMSIPPSAHAREIRKLISFIWSSIYYDSVCTRSLQSVCVSLLLKFREENHKPCGSVLCEILSKQKFSCLSLENFCELGMTQNPLVPYCIFKCKDTS